MKTKEKLFGCYFVQFSIGVLFALCTLYTVQSINMYLVNTIYLFNIFFISLLLRSGANIFQFQGNSNAWIEYSRAVIQLDHVILGGSIHIESFYRISRKKIHKNG